MSAALGEPVPRFTLPDENGRSVTLPARTGPTVLVFYRGDW